MRHAAIHRVDHGIGILYFIFFLLAFPAGAQTSIPVGSWRLHLSYNDIREVEVTGGHIFAAGESGILIFHRADQSLRTWNKLNGLSGTGITSLSYDPATASLLVGYEEGELDIIRAETITNFHRLRDADIATPKKINHISTREAFAYLSTAYGVVVFDLQRGEIVETWRDLGAGGSAMAVYESALLRDSIYLATANGVLAGYRGDNLLDYNNWERSSEGSFSDPVRSVISFDGKIYATASTGIYRLGSNTWVREQFLDTLEIQSLSSSSENLFMVADSTVWMMNTSRQLSKLSDERITAPAVIKQDESGNLWIGDHSGGLITNTGGDFSSFLPNGPSRNVVKRMVHSEGRLFVLPGGFSLSGTPLNIPGELNIFENGKWKTLTQPVSDLTDIALHGNNIYIASFGDGLLITDAAGNTTILDETNSPLKHAETGRSSVTALASSPDGLWVANYGGDQPLHLLNPDGSWESFSFNFPNAQHPVDLSVDGSGNVWMVLDPASGGGLIVLARATSQEYYKTDAEGSGNLPSRNVYSITTDRDGYIWTGTNAGTAYFFSPGADAIKPIYENRFLLRDETISAIEVDGGNRKWMGTRQGAWLFSSTGEVLLRHFTSENSPLLSDVISDIETHGPTGEVFFATDKGIISYRSDAMEAESGFENLKIFPNPVSPGYSGTVGITGLSEDAFVRITDISGKLVWQTQANGGMATWNVRDHQGRRAATGIYLVFAVSQDGRESMVGKIAVIE